MSTVTIDNLIYSLSGTDASVTGYSSPPTPWGLVIPSTITDLGTTYNITSIGYQAFNNCTDLTSITIPSSVTSVGNFAFSSCTGLTSIICNTYLRNFNYVFGGVNNIGLQITFDYVGAIPDNACQNKTNMTSVTLENITSIGTNAFKGSTGLASITIPSSVTSVGESAFSSCTGLTSITIPNSVTSVGIIAFSSCTGLTSITISSSVTSVGSYTFAGCSGLTSITFPNSVTSISNNSFTDCTGLTSITFSNSITSIGYFAFENCSSLTSITIPSSVINMDGSVFNRCYNLTNIVVDSNNPVYMSYSNIIFNKLQTTLVSYPRSIIGSYSIPSSVTIIGDSAFQDCTGLTSIAIPNLITSIGYAAFYGCKGLTSVIIPNSVTTMDNQAFRYCSNLTSVILSNSITSLNNRVFEFCSKITEIIIPASVTSINNLTFSGCTLLTKVYFLGNIPTIVSNNFGITGDTAYYITGATNTSRLTMFTNVITNTFAGSGLTNITIPRTVTSIGNNMFNSCTGLTSITIPSSVTSIGELSFANCTSLTNVFIPDSVTSIGAQLFLNCTSLTSVTIPNSIESIGSDFLSGCSSSVIVNYNPTVNDLPLDVIWYDFIIKLNSNNRVVLDGYFAVINSTNFIKLMYLKTNLTTNILAQYTNNDYGNNHSWDKNKNAFGNGGINITNIPLLDNIYNASKWSLYGSSLSYQNAANGNWIDLPKNVVTYSFTKLPNSPICFPAGTPVETDQGTIAIEKINPAKNTIRGKKIVAITKTVTMEDTVIYIEKDALGTNIPSQKTLISRNHKLLYNKEMIKAKHLVEQVEGVYNNKYKGEILYNVLLETHNTMMVNNLIVETLDPKSIIGKLYNSSYSEEKRNNIIININKCAKEYNKECITLKK